MIALDPDETVDVSLARWQQKPESSRPAFVFHYLTSSELRKVQRLRSEGEAAAAANRDDEVDSKFSDAIRIGLVGWKNIVDRKGAAVSYDPAKLDDVLSFQEKTELVYHYPGAIAIAEADLGKSESPSESATATPASAPTVPAANAKT